MQASRNAGTSRTRRRPVGWHGWHPSLTTLTNERDADGKDESAAGDAAGSTIPAEAEPVLLSGGNPQIAKADGDAPVQAYIAAMPGWKRDVGRRLDALIVRTVPGVEKAVRWNSPFYGSRGPGLVPQLPLLHEVREGGVLPRRVAAALPPGESKSKDVRYLDIHEDDQLDEELLASWIRQAAELPGWAP